MKKEYLIYKLSDEVKNSCKIDNDLFAKFGVKRGLRNEDGSGVVLYCTCGGRMYMLDGITGEEISTFDLSEGAIEASPAVYKNRVVIGTRACKIWGLELK